MQARIESGRLRVATMTASVGGPDTFQRTNMLGARPRSESAP